MTWVIEWLIHIRERKRALNSVKRALNSAKRALHSMKRALHLWGFVLVICDDVMTWVEQWLVHIRYMTRPCMWHDSFAYVRGPSSWEIFKCDVTRLTKIDAANWVCVLVCHQSCLCIDELCLSVCAGMSLVVSLYTMSHVSLVKKALRFAVMGWQRLVGFLKL